MSSDDSYEREFESLHVALRVALCEGSKPRAEAILRELRGRVERALAAGVPGARRDLGLTLLDAGALARNRGDEATALCDFDASLALLDPVLAGDPDDASVREAVAALHYDLGTAHSNEGRLDEAERHLRAAIPIHEACVRAAPDEPLRRNDLARAWFNLGNTLMFSRRGEEARACFYAACELWRALREADPGDVGVAHDLARGHFNDAWILEQSAPDEALAAYDHAREVWERLLEGADYLVEPRYDLARCCYARGCLATQLGRRDDALAAARRAVWHCERLLEIDPGDGGVAKLRDDAVGLRERLYRAAVALADAAARFDPTPASAHLAAAACFDLHCDLRDLGRYDGAEAALYAARYRWGALAAKHPGERGFRNGVNGTHNGLGVLRADTGRLDAAEESYRVALARREEAARADPDDAENRLYLGDVLCSLGNVHRDRGQSARAGEFFRRAIRALETVQGSMVGNPLVGRFLQNSRDGLSACERRPKRDLECFTSATVILGSPRGPASLRFEGRDPELAATLRRVDALRLADDPAVESVARELVQRAPDDADAWLLLGLVLGDFRSGRGVAAEWREARHVEATAAFYEAEARRAEFYEARLFRGVALRWAAHASQARLHALSTMRERFPPEDVEARLAAQQRRHRFDLERAREALEGAARLRPHEGAPLYALAELFASLGHGDAVRPYLEALRAVDADLWARANGGFAPRE